MSQLLAKLAAEMNGKKTREKILALAPRNVYDDGRTKQCHADECDISKIMARFDQSGTISHLAKYEPTYSDFSDFDLHEQMNVLTRGREVFDALPAEVRREFGQSPAAFFKYVNDPANADDLRKKLPALASPGTQLFAGTTPNADLDAATASASEPASAKPPPPEVDTLESTEK